MRNPAVLAALRAQIASIEGVATRCAAIPFGVDAIDRRLPAGGIACAALHEVAGSPDLADDASATIFLAGMLARTEGRVTAARRFTSASNAALTHVDDGLEQPTGRRCPAGGADQNEALRSLPRPRRDHRRLMTKLTI